MAGMTPMHWSWRALVVPMIAACAAGCGHPSGTSQRTTPATNEQSGDTAAPKRYAAKELPAVGERLPLLSDPRVELSPPEEWRVLARDPKYLARFVKGNDNNSLPRITVTAIEAPQAVEEVTEDNVAKFAGKMQKRAEGVKGRRMLEPARPIILGEVAWSRHVRSISAGGKAGAVQSLETARGGRLYIIELTVVASEDSQAALSTAILEYRDAAYAVAANW